MCSSDTWSKVDIFSGELYSFAIENLDIFLGIFGDLLKLVNGNIGVISGKVLTLARF